MNWAAYLTNRKESQKAAEKQRFLKAQEVIDEKKWIISGKVAYFGGTKESIRWIISLALTKEFQSDWLRVTIKYIVLC